MASTGIRATVRDLCCPRHCLGILSMKTIGCTHLRCTARRAECGICSRLTSSPAALTSSTMALLLKRALQVHDVRKAAVSEVCQGACAIRSPC
jgi:hypothetical protein